MSKLATAEDTRNLRYRMYNYVYKEGVSQKFISEKSGVPKSTIGYILSGRTKHISEDAWLAISNALDELGAKEFTEEPAKEETVIIEPGYDPETPLNKAIDAAFEKYEKKQSEDKGTIMVACDADSITLGVLQTRLVALLEQKNKLEETINALNNTIDYIRLEANLPVLPKGGIE